MFYIISLLATPMTIESVEKARNEPRSTGPLGLSCIARRLGKFTCDDQAQVMRGCARCCDCAAPSLRFIPHAPVSDPHGDGRRVRLWRQSLDPHAICLGCTKSAPRLWDFSRDLPETDSTTKDWTISFRRNRSRSGNRLAPYHAAGFKPTRLIDTRRVARPRRLPDRRREFGIGGMTRSWSG